MLEHEQIDSLETNVEKQEGDDSVINEEVIADTVTEQVEADTTETKTEDKTEEEVPDYRPKKPDYSPETAKIIAQRKENQELKRRLKELEDSSLKTNDTSLEELADDLGISVEAVKKMQKAFSPNTSSVEEKLNAILERDRQIESERNFNTDFEKWAKSDPDRMAKKDFYKTVAFNPEFLDLKNFDQMERKFFPGSPKRASIESGTASKTGATEKIDFQKMTDTQEAKVLNDPKLRAKYYAWLDSKS